MDRKQAIEVGKKAVEFFKGCRESPIKCYARASQETVEALQFILKDSEAIERVGGKFPEKLEELIKCPDCDGMGWYSGTQDDGNEEPEQVQVPCERCNGDGICGQRSENVISNKTIEQCLHAQAKLCRDCQAERAKKLEGLEDVIKKSSLYHCADIDYNEEKDLATAIRELLEGEHEPQAKI